MRLIDADALIERMYHDAFETDTDMQKWDSGCWIRYKMFENAMDSAPTVEERKKGKWLKRQIIGNVSFAYCSKCGEPILHGRVSPLWSYCPNCGADMREESEVEE